MKTTMEKRGGEKTPRETDKEGVVLIDDLNVKEICTNFNRASIIH